MFYVYLPASKPFGTLYVGATDDLLKRVWQHKVKAVPGYTAKYGVDRPVWFESHPSREGALIREKRIKEWKRAWRVELIEATNRRWDDLFDTIPQ